MTSLANWKAEQRSSLGLAGNPVTNSPVAIIAGANVTALQTALTVAANQGAQQARENSQQAKAQQATNAQAVYANLNVIQNQHGDVFLVVRHGQRIEVLAIDSSAAIDYIMLEVKEKAALSVGKDTVLRELGPIKAKAKRDGALHHTHNRCAKAVDKYVVDLGDTDGNVVTISADGWSVKPQGNLYFIRDPAYGELSKPACFGGVNEALDYLTGWIERQGFQGATIPLAAMTMVEYLRPDTPHPILAAIGEAGSGKSGAATRMGQCIDPTRSGELADVKLTPEDLAAAAQGSYLLSADNKSKLPHDVQDLLCKCSTGAVFVVRKYYGQTEALRLSLHAPLILTFVSLGITAPDLLDRTIVATIKRPAAYRNASELKTEFEAERPKVIGALYTLLAAGLAKIPEVVGQRKWKHRLVDFIQLGESIMQAAGKEPGHFIGFFEEHRATTATGVASGDSFMLELMAILKAVAKEAIHANKLPAWRSWGEGKGCGFAAILDDKGMVRIVIKAGTLLGKLPKFNQYIPENDRQLSDAMTRVSPLLRALGVEAEKRDAPGKRVVWGFRCKPEALND